jgi:hypothetical protein
MSPMNQICATVGSVADVAGLQVELLPNSAIARTKRK